MAAKYYTMATFITPYSGSATLSVASGLTVDSQGIWRFNQQGYVDYQTFGLSLGYPNPLDGGTLRVSATDWTIADIGNELTAYTDPETSTTYPASQCRILVVGRWLVTRQQNSNSFNSQGCLYTGSTETDLGTQTFADGFLLTYQSPLASYVIQGADVDGGAQDTFSSHEFYCSVTETASTDNSNHLFQSNSITRPTWVYTYTKSWQID